MLDLDRGRVHDSLPALQVVIIRMNESCKLGLFRHTLQVKKQNLRM